MTVATTGITVAGRIFRPVTSRSDGRVTGKRYNYLTSLFWLVGTDQGGDIRDLLWRVSRKGLGGAMLAGLLVEEVNGQPDPWTPETAEALTAFFDGAMESADAEATIKLMLQGLADFFPGALDSSALSGSALPRPAIPASISADPTTSSATPLENLAPSSASSPDMTPTPSIA